MGMTTDNSAGAIPAASVPGILVQGPPQVHTTPLKHQACHNYKLQHLDQCFVD